MSDDKVREWTLFRRHDMPGWSIAPPDGFVYLSHEPEPESVHVVAKSALTEALAEVETWKDRANINGKNAFSWQDKCEARDAEIKAWSEKWTTQNDQSGTHRLLQEYNLKLTAATAMIDQLAAHIDEMHWSDENDFGRGISIHIDEALAALAKYREGK